MNYDTKKDIEEINLKNENMVYDIDISDSHKNSSSENMEQINSFRDRLYFLTRKIQFTYKKENLVKIDSWKFLIRSLAMFSIEYLIYLCFQLVSYFYLKDFWHYSGFVPGLILGIIYAIIIILIILFSNTQNKAFLIVLKIFEAIIAFFLLGYLAVWDFGTISLTYIIILYIFLIFLFVR